MRVVEKENYILVMVRRLVVANRIMEIDNKDNEIENIRKNVKGLWLRAYAAIPVDMRDFLSPASPETENRSL